MSRAGLIAVREDTQARSVCAGTVKDAIVGERACGAALVSFTTHPGGKTLVFDADPLPMDSDTVDGVRVLFFVPQTHTHASEG